MSRSVKDLRELINISRLSFHGEDGLHESDERDEIVPHNLFQNGENSSLHPDAKLSTCLIKPAENIEQPRTSLRNGHFKPLPAINSSKTSKECVINKTDSKLEPDLAYQKCNYILQYIDGSVVSSWLHRSNESVQWLSKWVSTKEFFVWFAKFWLTEMDRQKQGELVEMEVGIILDEIAFSVQDGLRCKKVSQQDVMSFFLLIVWEYPSKICGPQSSMFVLNTLATLASGRKDKYRTLLSNVKFATKTPEQIHWILSVRAFALISVVTALVKFYASLIGHCLPNQDTDDSSEWHTKSIEDFAFDAVRLGCLNVLVYLVGEQNLKMSGLKNKDQLSLLFCAVTCGQAEIVRYILKRDKDVDMKQISKSGNGLLHAAVNTGDPSIVRLLLDAGADVNQTNMECEDVTPLHLAIMQGKPTPTSGQVLHIKREISIGINRERDSSEVVQLLLDAGAQINIKDTSDCPLHLAEDLERLHIVELIKKHIINED